MRRARRSSANSVLFPTASGRDVEGEAVVAIGRLVAARTVVAPIASGVAGRPSASTDRASTSGLALATGALAEDGAGACGDWADAAARRSRAATTRATSMVKVGSTSIHPGTINFSNGTTHGFSRSSACVGMRQGGLGSAALLVIAAWLSCGIVGRAACRSEEAIGVC